MNRKSLITFLAISFGLAWTLFCIPLAFQNPADPAGSLAYMQFFFALAMFAPGIGAIVATRVVEKQPILKTLRVNTLGPKRFYLAAWFLPALIVLGTVLVSALIGTAELDFNFSAMRASMAQTPAGTALPSVEILVLIQSLFALLIAPFINVLFAMGEELGWRGFLLPKLLPLGQWKAILISGVIWGLWHAPTTLLFGYNFPNHVHLGILIGIVGFTLLGTIFSWIMLKTRSPWAPALAHGAFNAVAGLMLIFLKPGFDTAFAGSPLGMAGWVATAIVIAVLVLTKQLPVAPEQSTAPTEDKTQTENQPTSTD